MNPNFGPQESGELRCELSFAYRVYRPHDASDEALVLLHGSGVDETTLVPLAREIAPHAELVAVRGRIPQEGGMRWFARITPTRFEQESIRAEVDAFADFIARLAEARQLNLRRTIFLGYSNGANLLSSLMLLHPSLIERAVLLRAMPVLDDDPTADLSRSRILVITGAADITYAPFAPSLVALLRRHGAEVEAHTIASGHEFGAADVKIVKEWLSRETGSAA
jgi:phospholipase/carboxylesterase